MRTLHLQERVYDACWVGEQRPITALGKHTHTYLSMTISCWLIEDALLPAAAADATLVTWRCLATDGT